MNSLRNWSAAGLALALLSLPARAGVELALRESWSCLFAGQEQLYHVEAASPGSFEGRLAWSLSAGGRVIDRGEQAISDKAPPAGLRLRVPPVNPGVALPGELAVSFSAAEGGPEVRIVRPLWFFSKEPFAGRSSWLKELRLNLFDPAGKTAALFEREKIPFILLTNPDALPALGRGLLIVGEGLSLKDYRGLPGNLLQAAAGGTDVLVLAPDGGEVTWETRSGAPVPAALSFGGFAIPTLDKRLDARAWPPDGRLVASSLTFRAERGALVGEFGKNAAGWPWIEVQPAPEGGRLTFCGLALVEKWDDTPVPRQLLLRLLEESEKRIKAATEAGRNLSGKESGS